MIGSKNGVSGLVSGVTSRKSYPGLAYRQSPPEMAFHGIVTECSTAALINHTPCSINFEGSGHDAPTQSAIRREKSSRMQRKNETRVNSGDGDDAARSRSRRVQQTNRSQSARAFFPRYASEIGLRNHALKLYEGLQFPPSTPRSGREIAIPSP
ncbi:hypothetical protein RRG08_056082 [Elysia crispata]|uniref:Uncharacterized protein n=1 Tax=Elysia crispata TaxID=231223 RepID=A0AAE1DEF5_9GAST|nr:hypothetical protein RRG08_056082 [Elysia crispata]